jgi:glycosyltransferase involved in cell wall biosynthesis
MLKILINAYACSPNMGSEPGMAWNWCINLAKYCELHIITEGEFKDNIEKVLPTLPQASNIHFYYNPVSDEVRRVCWNQGDWRFYVHHRKWQYKTYQIALDIIRSTHIDVLHQLNMIGFREPGYLWQIDNIPYIWGPVDAKMGFPAAYLKGSGWKSQVFNRLKNVVTELQLRFSPRVHKAAARAYRVIAASSNSRWSIEKFLCEESLLLNETGCYIQEYPVTDKSKKDFFDVLWVGKMDFRKQLGLCIKSIAASDNSKIRLHIVGSGNDEPYKKLAALLGISDRCFWHGAITHGEVQKKMQESDLFFFTSVAEGTPHVVLEAISNNLPVLCFDTCGQGDSVNDKVGVKVKLTTPKQSVKDFAQKLDHLSQHKDVLYAMALNCRQRQQELSWDNKAQTMVALYHEAIASHKFKRKEEVYIA